MTRPESNLPSVPKPYCTHLFLHLTYTMVLLLFIPTTITVTGKHTIMTASAQIQNTECCVVISLLDGRNIERVIMNRTWQ